MPSKFASLNGTGPHQVWGSLNFVKTDIANNRSQWAFEIRYYGNGYGTWTNNTQSWNVTGFFTSNGTFTIPKNKRYEKFISLRKATFWKTHNPDGSLPADNANFYMKVTISSGSGGEGTAVVHSGVPPQVRKGSRIKVEDEWKKSLRYIKHAGAWKPTIRYIKVNGKWRIGGG